MGGDGSVGAGGGGLDSGGGDSSELSVGSDDSVGAGDASGIVVSADGETGSVLEDEVTGGAGGFTSGTIIVVNVLAPLTAKAVQLNWMSVGADRFRRMVNPLGPTPLTK